MLPSDIGKLAKLYQLEMHGNQLQSLPASFNQLKQLEALRMTVVESSSMTLSSLPISELPKLRRLQIGNISDNTEYKKPRTEQETQQFQQLCDQRGIKLRWSI